MPFRPRRRHFDRFPDALSIADRQRNASRAVADLRRQGRALSPVTIDGSRIATTFWGKAWCDNLERYSDFATRLPRGRSYVRSGAVIDLQIAPRTVRALVSGTDLYTVEIAIAPVAAARWRDLCRACAGEIGSVIELLQGQLSKHVMTRVTEPATGLFPEPKEIRFTCSCPDAARMCKHVAAVLYGIGAQLDREPELLFRLRDVRQDELIASAGAGLSGQAAVPPASRRLNGANLSELFGIPIADLPVKRRRAKR